MTTTSNLPKPMTHYPTGRLSRATYRHREYLVAKGLASWYLPYKTVEARMEALTP